MDSSVILGSSNLRRPGFPLFSYNPRKVTSDSAFPSYGFLGEGGGRLSLGCACRITRKVVAVKRIGAKISGSGEAQDEEESDDALQATIEKSKKALAMQKNLLNQVSRIKPPHYSQSMLFFFFTNRKWQA